MAENPQNQSDETPASEPAPTPLVSVEQLSVSDYPVVHITEERLYAIGGHADRLSENSRGSVRNHMVGKLGEFSFAKPLGIVDEVDTKIYADGGDGGIDLQYRGGSIDVKTVGRHRSDPALTVDAHKPLNADYYGLVSRISETDFRIVGYAPRQFVANAPTRVKEGKSYHIVEQRYLSPFPSALL